MQRWHHYAIFWSLQKVVDIIILPPLLKQKLRWNSHIDSFPAWEASVLLKLKTSEYIEVGWLLHKLSLQVFAAIRLFAFLPQSFLWPVLKASPEAPSVPQLDTSTQNVPRCATNTLPPTFPQWSVPHTSTHCTVLHFHPQCATHLIHFLQALPCLLKAFKSFAPAPLYQRPKCRPNFKLQLLRNRNPSPSCPPTVFKMSANIIRGLGPNREQEMEDFWWKTDFWEFARSSFVDDFGERWSTIVSRHKP